MMMTNPGTVIGSWLGALALAVAWAAPVRAAEPGEAESATEAAPVIPGELDRHRFAVDLLPLAGTSTVTDGTDLRSLSFGLIGTFAGGTDGVAVAGVLGIDRHLVRGLQLSGAIGYVGGWVRGLQLAGGLSLTGAELRGLQLAGGGNLVLGALHGVQAAGGFNYCERLSGLQLGGGLNVAMRVDDGVQLGTVNLSAGDVHGAQVGLVNVAENADAAVGLVNLLWRGRWDVELGSGDTGLFSLAIRNGARVTHSQLSFGYHPLGRHVVYAMGGGLGGHAQLYRFLSADLDLLGRALYHGTDRDPEPGDWSFLGTLRFLLVVEPLARVSLYAGPSYNLLVTQVLRGGRFSWFGLRHSRFYDEEGELLGHTYAWPGVELGARFQLH
jgi:hypothetical protein